MEEQELFECNFCHNEFEVEEGIFLYEKYFVCNECFEVMDILIELQFDKDAVSQEELDEFLIETDLKGKTSITRERPSVQNMCKAECKETELSTPKNDIKLPVPIQIKERLDQVVIGQHDAKKMLSTAVYNHYLRLMNPSTTLPKSNLIMIGESGVGKTYLVQTIANLIDVPLLIADATSYTQTGWKGNDVSEMLVSLVLVSGGDVKKAERGIILLDEVDKLCIKQVSSTGGDINGTGVQQSLLKILEGSVITVDIRNNIFNIDTSNILFIGGGVFDGIDDVIARRLGKASNGMGFGSTHKKDVKIDRSTVISEDLIKYGFMPEFVGRFTNITVLNKLKEDDLVKIMTETTNSITQQYQKLFQLSGINLSFDEKVLHDIAKVAVDKGTGARALKTLLETEMKDLMFELPGSGVKEYTVKKIKKGKFKNEGN